MSEKTAIDGLAICENANLNSNALETQQPKQSTQPIHTVESKLAIGKTRKVISPDAAVALLETLQRGGRQMETTQRTDIVVNEDHRSTASPVSSSRFSEEDALPNSKLNNLHDFENNCEPEQVLSWASISRTEMVITGWKCSGLSKTGQLSPNKTAGTYLNSTNCSARSIRAQHLRRKSVKGDPWASHILLPPDQAIMAHFIRKIFSTGFQLGSLIADHDQKISRDTGEEK